MQQRIITIEGVHNFRDVGGYQTLDGRKVKWHKILRAGELSGLTIEGIHFLKEIGVKDIFDYRTPKEYEKAPDVTIEGIRHHLLPALNVDPAKNDAFLMHEHVRTKGTLKQFLGINNPLLHHYQAEAFYCDNKAYHRLIQHLVSDEEGAFIQHCTAGKDRTGWGVALVLLILGVDQETVMQDYLLTNDCRKDLTDKIIEQERPFLKDKESEEVLRSLMEVRKEYLQATLEGITRKYGDFGNYLLQEYQLTKSIHQKIKNKYLED